MTRHKLPRQAWDRLCRIQQHLHNWAEDECNGYIQWGDDGQPYRYRDDYYGSPTLRSGRAVNKEEKYLREAMNIAEECGGYVYYQTDPRGCALYFYRAEDLAGRSGHISEIYSTVATACVKGG